MRKTIKSILALSLVVATLFALLALSSCGTTGAIRDFLTAEEYTVQSGDMTVKVDGASVYTKNGKSEKYLYLVRDESMYYYCEIYDGKITSKRAIDSEKYILYRESMVSFVSTFSETMTAALHLEKETAKEDGTYHVNGYVVSLNDDGNIEITKDKQKIVISGVGTTVIEIPKNVLSKKAIKG